MNEIQAVRENLVRARKEALEEAIDGLLRALAMTSHGSEEEMQISAALNVAKMCTVSVDQLNPHAVRAVAKSLLSWVEDK